MGVANILLRFPTMINSVGSQMVYANYLCAYRCALYLAYSVTASKGQTLALDRILWLWEESTKLAAKIGHNLLTLQDFAQN